jgi:hypothetical protein
VHNAQELPSAVPGVVCDFDVSPGIGKPDLTDASPAGQVYQFVHKPGVFLLAWAARCVALGTCWTG